MAVDGANPAPPPRFSLCWLLTGVAISAAVFTALRFNPLASLVMLLALIGALLILYGFRARQSRLVHRGLGVWIVAVAIPVMIFPTRHWVGRTERSVQVIVVDGETLQRIPDASLELLRGPSHLHEHVVEDLDQEFTPIADAPADLRTNTRGQVEFEHMFWAYGSQGVFDNGGAFRPNKTWLRVKADGYRATYMPVDGQTARTRDLRDTSPILVTVPLGRE